MLYISPLCVYQFCVLIWLLRTVVLSFSLPQNQNWVMHMYLYMYTDTPTYTIICSTLCSLTSYYYLCLDPTLFRAPGDANTDRRALWVGNIHSSAITEGVVRKLFQQ